MIIWSGLGFLPVVFLVVFGLVLSTGSNEPISNSSLAYAFFLTGIASGVLGWYLRKKPAQILVDKATGKEIALRPSHSMFFIPMIYWGPIFIAMGLYVVIEAALKH